MQVEWSKALGGVPVLVSEADVDWVRRPNPSIETWSRRYEVAPRLTIHQVGGHFPGSSVVHWTAGANGKGVLLVSDTIHANPDRATVTFLRSYPNRIRRGCAATSMSSPEALSTLRRVVSAR